MEIRDASEADGTAIVDLASGDVDPAFLLRERSVRVAIGDSEPIEETAKNGAVVGFLAFDAHHDVVHVTRVGGDPDAIESLLDDVLAFARGAELPLEAVVPTGGSAAVALEAKGFESVGDGPRFQGRATTRFRYRVEQ